MIPYALLNGVSLSWCSLIGRLINRCDLWLIKAESLIKEIHFQLAGRKGGGGGGTQAGKISAEGTVGMPKFAKQGWGAFYGVSLWQDMGASWARTCSKAPCKALSPEPHGKLRNQHPSSHLLLGLMLLITLMNCVAIKKTRGSCQPGEIFFLQDVKEGRSQMQTTSEAHTWKHELYHPWEMQLGHPQAPKSLHRKEEYSPPLSTAAEKAGNKVCFYQSKPFFTCVPISGEPKPGRLLPASQESIFSTPCPETLPPPGSPHTHSQIPLR